MLPLQPNNRKILEGWIKTCGSNLMIHLFHIVYHTMCTRTHTHIHMNTHLHTDTHKNTHRHRERDTHTLTHTCQVLQFETNESLFSVLFNTPSSNRLKSKRVCVTWTRGCLFLIISIGNLKVPRALSYWPDHFDVVIPDLLDLHDQRGRWAGLQVQASGSAHVGWRLVLKVLGIWCKYCGKEQSHDLTGHFFTLLITSSWCVCSEVTHLNRLIYSTSGHMSKYVNIHETSNFVQNNKNTIMEKFTRNKQTW